jgi:surface protein
MFYSCGVKRLDLRNFNIGNVTDMSSMFDGCSNLETIYCEDDWNRGKILYSDYMFQNCQKLKGGRGTTWESDYLTNITFACVDKETEPGYFTAGEPTPVFECAEYKFVDVKGSVIKTLEIAQGETMELPALVDAAGRPVNVKYYDLADSEADWEKINVYSNSGENKWVVYGAQMTDYEIYVVAVTENGEGTECRYELPVLVVEKQLQPVSDTQVTSFDFSVVGPDGSDLFAVSLGAQDSYNAVAGRLEISSIVSEENVNEAIDNLLPGSSAFKSMIPSSITFKLPEGEGDIEIDCQTLPGFVLKVKVAEAGSASISSTLEQAVRGKANVHYKVSMPTYVVIYLSSAATSAPARIADGSRNIPQDGISGAYIYSVKVTPKQTPSGTGEMRSDEAETVRFFRDGMLYIFRNGHIYTVSGVEVR